MPGNNPFPKEIDIEYRILDTGRPVVITNPYTPPLALNASTGEWDTFLDLERLATSSELVDKEDFDDIVSNFLNQGTDGPP